MSGFQLDTSGIVTITKFDKENYLSYPEHVNFESLTLFARGYVEAMGRAYAESIGYQPKFGSHPFRFDMLAPETLARIMEDCLNRELAQDDLNFIDGERFWNERQRGCWTTYPPLTPYLGDDGKVYLREGV